MRNTLPSLLELGVDSYKESERNEDTDCKEQFGEDFDSEEDIYETYDKMYEKSIKILTKNKA